MEPVFTLPYPEYCIANFLADEFKTKDGYSVYAPLSRQEKGIDLILAKRNGCCCSTVSIQVKASRTYSPKPPAKGISKKYTYYTWFNSFNIPEEADFFTLVGIYPPEENRARKANHSWWSTVILLFTNAEMKHFMDNVKTKKGKKDKMFGFGFDQPDKLFQTRGLQNLREVDASGYLINCRMGMISRLLDSRLGKLAK